MKKFWKWMIKEGYAWKDDCNYYISCDSGNLVMSNCIPSTQILIGYKFEYLIEKDIKDFEFPDWNSIENIDNELNKLIEEAN